MSLTVRALIAGDGAEIVAAGALFDGPPDLATADRFLTTPGHHLLLAFVDGVAAGFISGVELSHPDKGTEMFVYELAVDEAYRRRGIGAGLLAALRATAQARGCYDMWVLTDHDNEAALATYRSTGATAESSHVMLTWDHLGPVEPADRD